ncbi:MFS transporter [Nocardia stercoris]|uniref:MFS transporter n=1 Tax=Nocardia stercoris TaxID=2483361 RepID=UPI001319F64B|nr:MFS transporter [Nocardia stercoris]
MTRKTHAGFDIESLLDPVPTPARRRFALIAVAALLATVTNAVLFMLPPLLPLMKDQLGLDSASETWIFTALTLGGGAGFILLPRLADVLSDRPTAVLAGGVLTLGALIPAVVYTYPAVLAGAALLGFGSSAQLLPLGFLRRHLSGGRVSTAVSVLIMATGGGVVAGMLGGGLTVRFLSVPTFFFIMAAVFVATTVALVLAVPRADPESAGAPGVFGTLWMIAWLTAILLTLTQGLLWGDAVLIPLVLGLAGYFTWRRFERRSAAPVFDLAILKMPYAKVACWAAGLFGAIDAGFLLSVTYYTQADPAQTGYGLGYDAFGTGLLMLPFALTMFISGKAAEQRVAKGRPGVVLLAGAAVSAVGVAVLTVDHRHIWAYLIGAGLIGLGSRAGYSGAFAVPQFLVPERKAGMAAGLVGTCMAIGIAFGSALVSALLLASPDPVTGQAPEAAYVDSYVCTLACALAVLVIVLVAHRRSHKAFVAVLRQTGVLT